MKNYFPLLFLLILTSCSPAQSSKNLLGGPCEGCEAIYEYNDRPLGAETTLPDFYRKGRPIKITGTVYQKDGRTPAPDVILYVYHTDQSGRYTAQSNAKGWEKRHGSIRGWMKTDEKGRYTFYTLRPGTYPSRTEPAHIHITVKEPDKRAYYLDSFYFEGDPLLTSKIKSQMMNRGGNGIIQLDQSGKIMVGKRDLVLGENIPNY
jgi:protocatechuate 3,4-dioxygenase beta subunit